MGRRGQIANSRTAAIEQASQPASLPACLRTKTCAGILVLGLATAQIAVARMAGV